MASKAVEKLEPGDRIMWGLASGQMVLTVDALLVFPRSWPTLSEAAIHVIEPDGQPRILEAFYEQVITLADDL